MNKNSIRIVNNSYFVRFVRQIMITYCLFLLTLFLVNLTFLAPFNCISAYHRLSFKIYYELWAIPQIVQLISLVFSLHLDKLALGRSTEDPFKFAFSLSLKFCQWVQETEPRLRGTRMSNLHNKCYHTSINKIIYREKTFYRVVKVGNLGQKCPLSVI